MQAQVTFLSQPFDELVEHLLKLRTFVFALVLIEHLLNLVLAEQFFINQRLQQRAAQSIERGVLLHWLARPVVIVIVAGIEQGIGQAFHQVAEVDAVNIEAVEF